ncbi:hypothetical protein [Pseudomonas sp. TWI628]|uniref:hypothetical protein n=1 Tax=Pseudomonas sp. TWI628 TaxID=3136788 RepID=UPI00320A416F
MAITGQFGLFKFPLHPDSYGSLANLRPGEFLNMVSFDNRRSIAQITSIETTLNSNSTLVNFVGAETTSMPASFKDAKRERPEKQVHRQAGESNMTFIQLYEFGELIAVFRSDEDTDRGHAVLTASKDIKYNGKNYFIDFRQADAVYDKDRLDVVYWDIYLYPYDTRK